MPPRLRRLVLWAVASVLVVLFVAVLGAVAIAPAAESPRAAGQGQDGLAAVLFYALSLVTLGGAALVAFVRNIVYSALGLLASLLGAGSLYVLLAADFVAIAQLLVYVG